MRYVDKKWQKEMAKGRPCCGGGWDTYHCPGCDGAQVPPVPKTVVVIARRKLTKQELSIFEGYPVEVRKPERGCEADTWIGQNDGKPVVLVDPPASLAIKAGRALGYWEANVSDQPLPIFFLEEGEIKQA